MKPFGKKETVLDNVLYAINADEEKNLYVDKDQLEIMTKELHAMKMYHSKLFVLFLNFHLPSGGFTRDNSIMSLFMKKLKTILVKKYGIKRMAYTWTREQNGTSFHQHYHVMIVLDGSKINSSYAIYPIIERLWKEVTEGSVYRLKPCFYNLRRAIYEGFADVVFRMSYHAKTDPVHMKPLHTHRYGTSRLRFGDKHKRIRSK